VKGVLLAVCFATALIAQPFKFDVSHLEGRASNTLDLSLTHSTLQFAAKFLDSKDPDEAEVKKLIEGIDDISIRSFEFKSAGVWTQADLEKLRSQLRAPEWSRMVGYKSAEEGESAEVYVREVDKKVAGVAIIDAEAKELTVVSISGKIDLESLAQLSGHFGVPKLEEKRK
jgi:hypothetical protein